MTPRTRDDRGAAATEFALVATVLLALVGLVAPLPFAFYERVQLERAVGKAARFAAARPESARVAADGTTIKPAFRPTAGQVVAEIRSDYSGSGTLSFPTGGFVRVAQANCPNGEARTTSAAVTISLGPFGKLFSGGGSGTKTLVASATACEE